MKKLLLLTLLCASQIQADETQNMNDSAMPVSSPVDSPKKPKTSRKKSGTGFFLTGDFIYWKAQEDNLEFGLTGLMQSVDNIPNATVVPGLSDSGETYSPVFEWSPGFKIGVGYVPARQGWEIYLNWCRFTTHAHGKKGLPNSFFLPQLLYGQWNIGASGFDVDQAIFAKWKMDYNVLDLQIGKELSIGRYFSLKPLAGLRGAWIDQDYHLTLDGITINNSKDNQSFKWIDSDFRSLGFRTGLDSAWRFNSHFSFFSKASISLLYGDFHNKYKCIRTIPAAGAFDQTIADIHNHYQSMKTEIEFALGFSYQTLFNQNKMGFACDIAWEYQNWMNLNQLYRPLMGDGSSAYNAGPPPSVYNYNSGGRFGHLNGDLGIMGLTVGARLDF
jgi:hypothetical protein